MAIADMYNKIETEGITIRFNKEFFVTSSANIMYETKNSIFFKR